MTPLSSTSEKSGTIMNVAIIPARGGSKRIPNKNILHFWGKPLISYSIEAAHATRLFDRIIVSTDSKRIADIARQWGADTPFMRPAELADDFTGTDAVIIHALKWLADNDLAYTNVCCIYATAPFIQSKYIIKGYELLTKHEATSAFSVTSFPAPIFRALKINPSHRLEMVWPEYLTARSQDLPEAYHDAGQFYWANIEKYLKEGWFYSKNAVPVILPRYLVHDIDTLEDLEIAEKYYDFFFSRKCGGDKEIIIL